MEHLTLTDLTTDQFIALQKTVTHRIALRDPLKKLWQDLSEKCLPPLVIASRFSDKQNPSGWITYPTKIPLPPNRYPSAISVYWIEQADWFLIEIFCITEAGDPVSQFIKAEVQGSKKYKAHALCVHVDRHSLQE
ncbi:hypothetical protein AH06_208 [Erwinia phage AH06]|nr:hypothetical protein AH06_208 [Erwinia phage AH06]